MGVRMDEELETELLAVIRPARRHGKARRPLRSTHRRPAVLLSALLAGGVASAVLGFSGVSVASTDATSVAAAQDALLTEEEGDLLRRSG